MHGIHVHTNASNLAIGAMLPQNLVGKCDQPIAYASKLLNNVKKNYTTTKRGALVMVCALHKFSREKSSTIKMNCKVVVVILGL